MSDSSETPRDRVLRYFDELLACIPNDRAARQYGEAYASRMSGRRESLTIAREDIAELLS